MSSAIIEKFHSCSGMMVYVLGRVGFSSNIFLMLIYTNTPFSAAMRLYCIVCIILRVRPMEDINKLNIMCI